MPDVIPKPTPLVPISGAVFVAVGERPNDVAFQALLRRPGLPWVKRASPEGHNDFYQHGGPCHAALNTRQLLVVSMDVYWPSELWPPPYLHLLEYSICSVL